MKEEHHPDEEKDPRMVDLRSSEGGIDDSVQHTTLAAAGQVHHDNNQKRRKVQQVSIAVALVPKTVHAYH